MSCNEKKKKRNEQLIFNFSTLSPFKTKMIVIHNKI